MAESKKSPKVGRTMKAAHRAAEDGDGQIVKAGELIDVRFLKGQSPSLTARRTLALMLGAAAGDSWRPVAHRLTKREIRQAHKGNERMADLLDEVASVRLSIEGISSRGRAAILRAGLFKRIIEETDDGDSAWVEFEFNDDARRLFGASDTYGSLNRAALLAFKSRYSVTLYELGCLYSGRREPRLRLSVEELRQKMGIEKGKYRDWAQLRRKVLQQAKAEIDHLSHFTMHFKEERQGRRVTHVELVFWLKDPESIDEAAKEVERPKVGRKARRAGTTEHVASREDELPEPSLGDDEIPY